MTIIWTSPNIMHSALQTRSTFTIRFLREYVQDHVIDHQITWVSPSRGSSRTTNVLNVLVFAPQVTWCDVASLTERIRRQPAEIVIGALKKKSLTSHWDLGLTPSLMYSKNVARGLQSLIRFRSIIHMNAHLMKYMTFPRIKISTRCGLVNLAGL